MDNSAPTFSILLIDDNPVEKHRILDILKSLTDVPFQIDHVLKCSLALALLRDRTYDLVLLEYRLSQRISARFSVPMIKAAIALAPIAIISNEPSSFARPDSSQLSVDYWVDNADMSDFLKSQLDYRLGGRGLPSSELAPVS